jgi:predicted RNase H-like nuclease (RuvC/YqgF family)
LDAGADSFLSRWDLMARVGGLQTSVEQSSTKNERLKQQNAEHTSPIMNLESSLRSLQSILDSKPTSRTRAGTPPVIQTPSPVISPNSSDSVDTNLLAEVHSAHKVLASMTSERDALAATLIQKSDELSSFSTQVEAIQSKFDAIVLEKISKDSQVQTLIRNYDLSETHAIQLKSLLREKCDQFDSLNNEHELLKSNTNEALE